MLILMELGQYYLEEIKIFQALPNKSLGVKPTLKHT